MDACIMFVENFIGMQDAFIKGDNSFQVSKMLLNTQLVIRA